MNRCLRALFASQHKFLILGRGDRFGFVIFCLQVIQVKLVSNVDSESLNDGLVY